MARKKTYYFEPKQGNKVERLAYRLKVSESQIMRMMVDTYDEKLWFQTLKIRKDV